MTVRWIRFLFALLAALPLLLPPPAAGGGAPGRIRVPLRDLIAEGLAWDSEDGVFYLSSTHRRSIFRVDMQGGWSELGPIADPDAFQMLGMKVDAEGRRLWVCSTAFNAGPDRGRTAIYLLDLATGRTIQRFAPPGDSRGPMVNDLVLTREGRVFATDTEQGSLQTISGGTLVPTLPAGTFRWPNGIALSRDERQLFVADQQGIHRVPLESGRPNGMTRFLPPPPGATTLGGIDGLYAIGGDLVGIQNGRPEEERIVRMRLNAGADSILAVETLLAGHPLWNIPTTGTLAGGDFWYLANSQLDRVDAEGRLAPLDSLDDTEILRLTPPLGLPGASAPAGPLRVFLLGDAGEPHAGGEPVLQALQSEITRDPARSLVVVLGDNIYPTGLPDSSDARHGEMERRLLDQIAALRGAALGTYIIPGNHDWARGGADGWEAVRRQDRLIRRAAAAGGPALRLVPPDGCPGPTVIDIESSFRLVALDTQWWLHAEAKPVDPESSCACDAPAEITDALRDAVAGASIRSVLVVGHHPLASHGRHGGHFPPLDHIFPLRAFHDALWLPLPIVGSLYPIARRNGASDQDMSGGANERMRAAIMAALAGAPPLLYASGHDHNLQVLKGRGARNIAVSGSGIFGHGERVAVKGDTRYASREAGFMRVDLESDGSGRIVVFRVTQAGTAHESWSGPLE